MPPIATRGRCSSAARCSNAGVARRVVCLVVVGKKRTEGHIAGARCGCRARVLDLVVARHPDDGLLAQQRACRRYITIVFAQMHALRTDLRRQLRIVVDDQWHTVCRAQFVQGAGLTQPQRRVRLLVAVLQPGDRRQQWRRAQEQALRVGLVRGDQVHTANVKTVGHVSASESGGWDGTM